MTYNDGIMAFINALRDSHNPEGRRMAAKGLQNLTEKDNKLRLRVLSELSEEIR